MTVDPTRLRKGTYLAQCQGFSTEKIFTAEQIVINRFSEVFFGGDHLVSTPIINQDGKWWHSDDARSASLQVWQNMTNLYDVVDSYILHHVSPFTLKSYLLGKTWCVYHPLELEVLTPGGESLSELDCTPQIWVRGIEVESGAYSLLSAEDISRAREVVENDLQTLKLRFVTEHIDVPQEEQYVGYIEFPVAVYGSKIGLRRIRCVLEDGTSVQPIQLIRPN